MRLIHVGCFWFTVVYSASMAQQSATCDMQVVLLGPGFDTRPFRLQWPPGTSFFSVAPTLVHDQMQETLGSAALKGCLSPGCACTPINVNMLVSTQPKSSVPNCILNCIPGIT